MTITFVKWVKVIVAAVKAPSANDKGNAVCNMAARNGHPLCMNSMKTAIPLHFIS